MNLTITAETTDEQIIAPLMDAKKRLAEFATAQVGSEYFEGERLVGAAQTVFTREALVSAQMQYRDLLKTDASKVSLVTYLLDISVRTDDTWSGRTNDARRSCSDAVRGWARDAARDLGRS